MTLSLIKALPRTNLQELYFEKGSHETSGLVWDFALINEVLLDILPKTRITHLGKHACWSCDRHNYSHGWFISCLDHEKSGVFGHRNLGPNLKTAFQVKGIEFRNANGEEIVCCSDPLTSKIYF